MKHFISGEDGHVIVEATIIFPIAIIMVIALFYAAIFLCQRANLQANLNNAIIYYKNIQSDTYLEQPGTDMTYMVSSDTKKGGTQYSGQTGVRIPYRKFFIDDRAEDKTEFDKFFRKMAGTMFFDTGDNVETTLDSVNYVIYQELIATVKQTVSPAISLEMVGIDNEMTITASASAVISDGDNFVNNVDFIKELIVSRWGSQLDGFKEKISEIYGKFKRLFKQ